MSYLEEREPRVRIDDFRRLDDERKHEDGYNDKSKDMYNAMLTLILDHKKELQKIPATSSLPSATIWARKRGLRAGTEDFNGDGIPEVVVYNKAGNPWIINGYKLKSSDYAQRNAFYTQFPDAESRVGESMKSWLQDRVYDIRDDPENPWRKHIRLTDEGRRMQDSGYKLPTKPKKKLSVFNIWCKVVAPVVKEYYENREAQYPSSLLGGWDCVKVFKKIISPIAMYRMLYLKMVERAYFFHLRESERFKRMSYAQFKQYLKRNENHFSKWFMDNYLTPDKTEIKRARVNAEYIKGQIVKGELNWDGSDPDDAIVFMIGIKNYQDNDCNAALFNNDYATQFLNMLSDKQSPYHKSAMKRLAKWKKVASESQKEFFKNMVRYLFEDEEAEARFRQARDAGMNELANTTDEARQQAVDVPVTPLRQPAVPIVEDNQQQYESDNQQQDVVDDADDEGDN